MKYIAKIIIIREMLIKVLVVNYKNLKYSIINN